MDNNLAEHNQNNTPSYWIGGAIWGVSPQDMSQDFINKGIYAIDFEQYDISDKIRDISKFNEWISNLTDNSAKKAFTQFSQMKAGDIIAIKSLFSKTVPNEPKPVSTLRIKAIGTVVYDFFTGYRFDEELWHTIPIKWEVTISNDYDFSDYRDTIHQIINEEDIRLIFNLRQQLLGGNFKKWATTTQPNKNIYATKTVDNYLYALKSVCKDLVDINLSQPNLLYQANTREFKKLQDTIRNSALFDKVNKNGNRVFSSGLSLYEKFLEAREREDIDFLIPELPYTEPQIEDTKTTPDKYNKHNFLEEIYIDEAKYNDITTLLTRKKNIILQGAPGVGKSFLAKRLAYSIIGAKDINKVEMIQFHQNYSYEDFIEGFRPVNNGHFNIKHGVFYRFCDKAKIDTKNKYFFIIDEINRGNLSKIMGELMFLLEGDKRGKEFAMSLTYSGDKFYVPENVYIIGMMNTADRSLAMIDYALRRRFSFIPIEPAFNNAQFINTFKANYANADTVIGKMQKLNKLIIGELDSGHQIGHSYFCSTIPFEESDIQNIYKYEIKELLQEYFFDNTSKLEEALRILDPF